MTYVDPDLINRVNEWRAMERAGTMTDELRLKAVLYMREKRRAAATLSEAGTKKTKSSKPARSADDLLGELGI